MKIKSMPFIIKVAPRSRRWQKCWVSEGTAVGIDSETQCLTHSVMSSLYCIAERLKAGMAGFETR